MSGQSLAAAPMRGFHSSHSSSHSSYHSSYHGSYHGYRGYHGSSVHHYHHYYGSYGGSGVGGFSTGLMLMLIIGVLVIACIVHAMHGHRDAYRDG